MKSSSTFHIPLQVPEVGAVENEIQHLNVVLFSWTKNLRFVQFK